jgi:16S rRNA (cytidine1402-2'-O)-methyltransferase
MQGGQHIALVSDAGMPGISDPGHRLIAACIAAGIPIEPIPGASSLITGLVVSGLPADSFVYQGFLPRKQGERRTLLTELLSMRRTVVLFESPRRIKHTLHEIAEIDSERRVVIARELTKKFEEVIRGSATDVGRRLADRDIKGEIVLVCGPGEPKKREATVDELQKAVMNQIAEGTAKKDAIANVAGEFGVSKKIVYEAVKDIHEQSRIKGRV